MIDCFQFIIFSFNMQHFLFKRYRLLFSFSSIYTAEWPETAYSDIADYAISSWAEMAGLE